MKKLMKQLAATAGAGALMFALFGSASASAPGPAVEPIWHDGNITIDGEGNTDKADCDAADAVETGSVNGDEDASGSATTTNGVTVNWTYDAETKELSFTATGGVVMIAYIKGGSAYNGYHYDPGVSADNHLVAPDNGSDGPAGLSHAVFCTEAGTTTSTTTSFSDTQSGTTESTSTDTSFSDTQSGTTTQPPSDTLGETGSGQQSGSMWLLLAALGVLAGSVIVLAPSKAKNKD